MTRNSETQTPGALISSRGGDGIRKEDRAGGGVRWPSESVVTPPLSTYLALCVGTTWLFLTYILL